MAVRECDNVDSRTVKLEAVHRWLTHLTRIGVERTVVGRVEETVTVSVWVAGVTHLPADVRLS